MESVLNQSAHLMGNYHKYYTFHSAQCRIDLLDGRNFFRQLWEAQGSKPHFNFLDIGCNEGDLTIALYNVIRRDLPSDVEVKLFGIDIDPALIDLAKGKVNEADEARMTFMAVDATNNEHLEAFRSKLGADRMSLVTVFSTTMWIHVNHGDEGLQRFLIDAHSFLHDTGVLLIEPQPGRCYTNAAKRCRKLGIDKPPFLHCVDKTKVHETISKMVKDEVRIGYQDMYCFGQEDWGRALMLFHNFGADWMGNSSTVKEKVVAVPSKDVSEADSINIPNPTSTVSCSESSEVKEIREEGKLL